MLIRKFNSEHRSGKYADDFSFGYNWSVGRHGRGVASVVWSWDFVSIAFKNQGSRTCSLTKKERLSSAASYTCDLCGLAAVVGK
jgi:hypothetical protein